MGLNGDISRQWQQQTKWESGAQMVIFSIQPFNVAGQIWFKKSLIHKLQPHDALIISCLLTPPNYNHSTHGLLILLLHIVAYRSLLYQRLPADVLVLVGPS